MQRGRADANSPCRHLAARNFGAFVAFGMGPGLQFMEIHNLLIAAHIALKGIQVQNKRRSHDLAQAALFSDKSGVR